jgi:hypothetical protein
MLTKELGMTTIDKKYCLINKICPNKMFKCIVLDLIFGIILRLDALKDMMIRKVAFMKFIELYFKKSRLNNQNHTICETIYNNK